MRAARRIAAAVAAALALGAAPAARAGELPPAGAELGGGASPLQLTDSTLSEGVTIGARVGGDRRTVRLSGSVAADCSLELSLRRSFDGQVKLADDGSFSGTFPGRRQFLASRGTAAVTVSGTFDGARVIGIARVDGTVREGPPQSCRGPARRFELRAPGAGVAPPAPAPAAALLYGVTDDRAGGVAAPIVLRTGPGGRTIAAVLYTLQTSCSGVPRLFNNYTPAIRVKSDGAFAGGETFRITYRDAVDTFRVRISGRFLAGPAVEGTIALSVTSRPRRGTRVRRCANAARARFRALA